MAANGEHQGVVKAPPTPSLRFSKFFESNMRILVTGGGGFIGSHLVDKLIENEKNETWRRLAQNKEAARKSKLTKKAYVQQLESSRIKLTQLKQEPQRARAGRVLRVQVL